MSANFRACPPMTRDRDSYVTSYIRNKMEEQVKGDRLEGRLDTPTDCPSLFRLTHSQKERIERNKLKAKALKHARLVDRQHQGPSNKITKTQVGSQISSVGGYMIDTEDGSERLSANYKLVEEEGGLVCNTSNTSHSYISTRQSFVQ